MPVKDRANKRERERESRFYPVFVVCAVSLRETLRASGAVRSHLSREKTRLRSRPAITCDGCRGVGYSSGFGSRFSDEEIVLHILQGAASSDSWIDMGHAYKEFLPAVMYK